ncbi:MAG: helix-turn-helix domain-containing protein [Lachnospiraceae bacterium]|nr:helix-turn-helix domain-containing protein [Lachnospiraceae bacterium]
MIHKIKSVETGDNLILTATFLDGTVKEYDVKVLFKIYPQMKALEDRKLFDSVQIDVGGYGISWNDDLDLESETVWEDGIWIETRPSDSRQRLAARLAEARALTGMTQKQLAEKTGIYQADISRIERGIANPSISTLQRLAEGLEMDLDVRFI